MNPLITNINAHVQSETLATRTIIAWNPVTNTGSINYECSDFYQLRSDGSYFGVPVPNNTISVPLEEVINETVNVQVAPGVFQPVPMALVAGAIKAHFAAKVAQLRARNAG